MLRALVAYYNDVLGPVRPPRFIPLEKAAEFQRLGFWVLIDPQDEEDLVRWEQRQRAAQPKRRRGWFGEDLHD